LAQGLKSSFIDSFDATVRGDYIVSAKNYMTLPNGATLSVEAVPTVEAAAGVDMQQAQAGKAGKAGALIPIYGVDPRVFQDVWHFTWLEGNDAVLDDLGADGVAVEEQTASSLGVKVGDKLPVTTLDGETADLEVRGIYRDAMMLNGVTVSSTGYQALFPKPALFMIIAKAVPGSDLAATKSAIESALADVPTAQVQTSAEYKDTMVGMVNQLLNLLYLLLAMSVIISLFGIVNTLVLAVYERTREIGLTRAIGMSRRQVRATVRYESVITSIIGALMGIVVGVVFAWVVTTRFAGQGITFSIPGVQLVVFLIVAMFVGVIAAIVPARRAARIDILKAIQYE